MLPLVLTLAKLSSMSFHFQEILSSLDCSGLFYIVHNWISVKDTKNHKKKCLKIIIEFNFQIRNETRLCDSKTKTQELKTKTKYLCLKQT
jgi:hypothetical protein